MFRLVPMLKKGKCEDKTALAFLCQNISKQIQKKYNLHLKEDQRKMKNKWPKGIQTNKKLKVQLKKIEELGKFCTDTKNEIPKEKSSSLNPTTTKANSNFLGMSLKEFEQKPALKIKEEN